MSPYQQKDFLFLCGSNLNLNAGHRCLRVISERNSDEIMPESPSAHTPAATPMEAEFTVDAR